jgi:alanine-glyoxylate transaminase/serine-glyoxylate transaminase/serine-pyruvate transaminase
MDSLNINLKSIFNINNKSAFVIPITGSGTAAMEILIGNIISENEEALVGENGFFGERMSEINKKYPAALPQGILRLLFENQSNKLG